MPFKIVEPKEFPYLDYKRYSFSLGVKSGDYVFTSGSSASEYDDHVKKIVCRGNLEDQVRLIHDKLNLILEAGGSKFDQVVKITDYVSPQAANHTEAIDKVRSEYFGKTLPFQSKIFVESLVRPDALLETEFVATTNGNGDSIFKFLSSKTPDSSVFRRGNIAFALGVSEQSGSLKLCAVNAYKSCIKNLALAGLSKEDIVLISERVLIGQYGKLSSSSDLTQARAEIFGSDIPPVTTIHVGKLSKPNSVIEIECTVFVDGNSEKSAKHIIRFYQPNFPIECNAVRSGELYFISCVQGFPQLESQTGAREIVSQTGLIYRAIEEALSSLGSSKNGIMKTVDYFTVSDRDNYKQTGKLRHDLFSGRFPASTGVMVKNLFPDTSRIAIECIASN